MRSNLNLTVITLCACLCGVSQQAMAQEPAAAEEQATGPATAPEAGAVPPYQSSTTASQYQLTAQAGSGGQGQSEARRWPNRPLMVTSTLMFTASYVPAVIMAAVDDDTTTDNLYIPVAGPWLELAREPASPGNKALLAISGVFQDLGALGMVTSLFVPERKTSRWYLIGNRRFSAAPVASGLAYGVSARGEF